MTHACPLVMRVVPWREALGRGTSAESHVHVMGQMIPMTQGSLPRSFKAIRVGSPAVDHVDRRPSKINESWAESHVHVMGQNEAYDTRKPHEKFQGHPSRSPGGRPRGSPSTQNQ
ncbi:uncharacterized protein G2W53_040031 [Senna tora]|uniref:Uncharacterized protein n=1 Tax=Senna tora TaxID=362788 RepID=A0A834SS20_9FABA|nr:uncharacterized protein G2W53_040031 [Senna tora]